MLIASGAWARESDDLLRSIDGLQHIPEYPAIRQAITNGNIEQALALLKDGNAQECLRQARRAVEQGQTESAIRSYEAALDLNPRDEDARAALRALRAPPPAPELASVTAPADPPPAEVERPETAPAFLAAGEPDEQLADFTMSDTPLVDAVKMFTKISGANIVAATTNLSGTVTVSLHQVPWRVALASILDMHNLTLVEKTPGSRVYSIVEKRPEDQSPFFSRTFFLQYVTPSEIVGSVQPLLATNSIVNEFPSRNALVVRSSSESLSEVGALIRQLDIPGKQVCVETKFVELSEAASKKLGIRWDSLDEFGLKVGVGPFTKSVEKNTTTTRNDSRTDTSTKTANDTATQLYDVNGEPYEIRKVEFTESPDGTIIQNDTITPTRSVTKTAQSSSVLLAKDAEDFSRKIVEKQAAILELDSLQLVLSALKSTEGVSIVSNPKIIVANGVTNALFSVGRRDPIIKTQITRGTQDSPGDKETAELATDINTDFIKEGYLETGVELQVVPTVKTRDIIQVEINPSLRRLVGEKTVGGNSWPVISVKDIRTQFSLRSGQTVAIGGLTDMTESKREVKVPFLGDIPVLGRLFRHNADVKEQVETIIFVTLWVIEPEDLLEATGIPGTAGIIRRRLVEDRVHDLRAQADLLRTKSPAPAAAARP